MTVDVGELHTFPDGEVTVVAVDGREIGIVRWVDDVFALANLCAHQRGPLCRGTIVSRLDAADPGNMELADGPPVIACPWHGWEFDVQTGRAVWDDRYRVRTFPAHVVDGRVLVDLQARREATR
jgi:nitrite reductase/ring-hydroxylating ferredoxin subunit